MLHDWSEADSYTRYAHDVELVGVQPRTCLPGSVLRI